MSFWKQLLLAAAILAGAFAAWIYYVPGAQKTLAQYGLEWLAEPFPAKSTQAAEGGGGPSRGGGRRGGAALVITAEVGRDLVNDRLTAIGTGQAAQTVSVRPLVSGQIADIPVVSGAKVEKGDVIILLDSDEEQLAVERAELSATQAADKAKRLESLVARRAISSVEADQARNDLEAAKVAVSEARLALARRTVTAPIAGTLGILSVNTGDYVTSQTEIATIDDRSTIEIEFYVPERFTSAMATGKPVEAESTARPGEKFAGEIVALDNRIDATSRTLRVRARIPNTDDRLRAGMSFEVTLRFEGDSYPSVDPLSIQWDSAGAYVWRVSEGKAGRVDIAVIQRNADRVLVQGELDDGDAVVTEGVQNVRPGADVVDANAPRDGDGNSTGQGRRPEAAAKAGS